MNNKHRFTVENPNQQNHHLKYSHPFPNKKNQSFVTHQRYIQVCVLDNTIILVYLALVCRISNAPFHLLDNIPTYCSKNK